MGDILSDMRPSNELIKQIINMIEVNLYAIPAGDNNATVGRCVARNRFDREAMGISVEEFVKGFLKDNLDKFEAKVGIGELSEVINSATTFGRKDIACLNYYLIKAGYTLQIINVADDEENATGVPTGDVVEWNFIDENFIQNDYPTATKFMPNAEMDIPAVLKQAVEQSGLFNSDKFAGLKNPFTELFANIERIKTVSGSINTALVSRIYETLDQVGLKVFCATSED